MARLARVVIPELPHLVTQRGNDRQRVFFGEDDYRLYRDGLAAACRAASVQVWGWCLMPNHVHLVLVPNDSDGLRRSLAPLHRRYAGLMHARQGRSGHFWQGRYGAVALDEDYLGAALRYVALNPVRAGLAASAGDWPWSSAAAQIAGREDGVTALAPVHARFAHFADHLALGPDEPAFERLRKAESIGRPLGSHAFLAHLKLITGRDLEPARRGPKPKGRLSRS